MPGQVEELLLQWEEAHESGNPISAEELCADYPQLLPELKTRIQKLRAMDRWLEPLSTVGFLDPALKACPEIVGYEILSEVARGGMGVVYRARHVDLDQERAVKVMIAGPKASPQHLKRFQREMRILARMEHENIVRIHEAQCVGGQPFFIMPYIPQGSLAEHLDRFRNDPVATARLMEQVAGAIDHAHGFGILHRDLKPRNILLGAEDKPLVSDFGVAKVLTVFQELARTDPEVDEPQAEGIRSTASRHDWVGSSGTGPQTIEGAMVGTWPYMAPEQVLGETSRIGPGADVWALGVILYQVLGGKRPFRGPSPADYLVQIPAGKFVPLHRLNPQIDKTLSAIVSRCLHCGPEDRYLTAKALADDLRAWRTGRRVRGAPESYPRRVRRWLWAAALPACLLAAGGISVYALVWLGPGEAPANREYQVRVREYLDRLAAGETLHLVDATDRPSVGRVRYGKADVYPATNESPLVVQATGVTAYELLAEVPLQAYRIRVRLRNKHRGLSFDSLVGVYWGFGEIEAESQGYRSFLALCYANWGPKLEPDLTRFQTRHWIFADPQPSEPAPRHISPVTPPTETRGDVTLPRFPLNNPVGPRELVVEVRQGSLRTSVEGGKQLVHVSAVDLRERVRRTARSLAEKWPLTRELRPLYNPNGGIGIFVNGSAVSVEQFDVEPLP